MDTKVKGGKIKMDEKKEEKLLIVTDLPEVKTRTVEGSDGNTYNLVTTNEAIQEILEISRELKKGITG